MKFFALLFLTLLLTACETRPLLDVGYLATPMGHEPR